jgi:S1-C subfamily serine protease
MSRLAAALLLLAALPAVATAQEDREGVRKTYETLRPSTVGIEISLRRKTRLEKSEHADAAPDAETQRLFQLAENGQLLETWGVVVAPDLILMADKRLKASDVERIRVRDASGASFDAEFGPVGRRHDFVLLKPVGAPGLTPLAFGEWSPPKLGETFHVTYADFADGAWQLNVSPYIMTNAPLAPAEDWFCLDQLRPGSVVSDARGVPVGIALDAYLWVRKDGRSSFLGKALLADERVGDLEDRAAELRGRLAENLHRIEISFKAEPAPSRFMPSDESRARAVVFGVPVDDQGSLFVAEDLPRDQVRRIEDLWVQDGDTRREARFVGLWKDVGGFLVQVPGLKTRPLPALDGAAPPPGDLFFSATLEDRFGRVRIRIEPNRIFRLDRGLAGAPRLHPRRRIPPGSLLLDFEGRLVGYATLDRKEEDLEELAAEASRDRFGFGRLGSGYVPEHLRRLLYFSERVGQFAPGPHFDPRAVPVSRKADKGLVWLGVEFQEMSKPLAEALGIQDRELSNDGRRGLLVTELYPGSPAERAGIRVDDVLLCVAVGEGSARDLVGEQDRFGLAGRLGMMGLGERRPGSLIPWKGTSNYLNTFLSGLGAGAQARFEVLRGREKRLVTIELEKAPVDYESADRHKDEVLGFTVKELTYEVRYYQKLDPAVTGVVVSRVESGSKSDVAKLPALSIITRVNDAAVRDLAHFKSLTEALRTVTLTTVSHGQTKLIELSRD